jgi:histidine triad (HIT) family protein
MLWWSVDETGQDSAECMFCKIVAGELPSREVYSDSEVYAFKDISPVAPVHVLLVPREHVTFIHTTGAAQQALLGRLLQTVPKIAEEAGLTQRGYRIVVNQGPNAGQMVDHLHLHVLGGEPLAPMGVRRVES